MPTPTIPAGNLFMNATLYTGTGAALTVANGAAGQAFQPDFVWLKIRNANNNHALYDSVRGVRVLLSSSTTNADYTDAAGAGLTSFNSNGFGLGTDTATSASTNSSGYTFVGWNWKAGGAAVSNTSGTITSQVSANTTSGFSIVTYTGVGTNPSTIGHGLGVAPSMVIVKSRSNAYDWNVYHSALGGNYVGYLDLSQNFGANASYWANTNPTSSVFTVGNNSTTNGSGTTFVAYCFAPVAGYSAFGSYTSNASTDGPFIYTGFRPRFVMIKCSSVASTNWIILDTSRNTYNQMNLELAPNSSAAENGLQTDEYIDTLSNGFKIRTTQADLNYTAGTTYIYMAFAENPFKYANAR